MNPLALGLLLYVTLGIELALRPTLGLGQSGIAPSLMLGVVCFVAMFTPVGVTLWVALLAGLAVDLSGPRALEGGGTVWVLGPNALGFALGAYAVLQLRALLVRGNPLSVGILAFLAAVLAAVVATAVLFLRVQVEGMFDYSARLAFSAQGELIARLGSAVYTGVVAVPLTLMLRPLMGLLGLQDPHARRFGR
jgi:cell shape-determining protein MreD